MTTDSAFRGGVRSAPAPQNLPSEKYSKKWCLENGYDLITLNFSEVALVKNGNTIKAWKNEDFSNIGINKFSDITFDNSLIQEAIRKNE